MYDFLIRARLWAMIIYVFKKNTTRFTSGDHGADVAEERIFFT